MREQKFDFDDILIKPEILTQIKSRYSDINPYKNNGCLPLFTAPMDTVVNEYNEKIYHDNKINVCLPRTVKCIEDIVMDGENMTTFYNNKVNKNSFISFGLDEFRKYFTKNNCSEAMTHKRVLLDVANGHMEDIIDLCYEAKKINPKLIIMAGNIANPSTYRRYIESGCIDYARIGIGSGVGCLTSENCGVGFPMASLIEECNKIKKDFEFYNETSKEHNSKPSLLPNQRIYKITKIVADGGMKKYSDVIKALALGADYVMIGSIFNKALESSAPTYWKKMQLSPNVAETLYNKNATLYKEFRGMSTKAAQKAMGKTELKTSEGVTRKHKVEYKLSQWVENFEHYLRSTMSYTNSKNLEEFIGQVDYNLISENAFKRFNK